MTSGGSNSADTNGGFLAPAGVPKEIVAKLNTEINAVLNMPDVRAKLEAAGIEIQGGTPQNYAALIKSDLEKWGKVIKDNEQQTSVTHPSIPTAD